MLHFEGEHNFGHKEMSAIVHGVGITDAVMYNEFVVEIL